MKIERLARIGWLALAAAAGAGAHEREIAVGLNASAVPYELLAVAKATAAQIYAGIGVKLRWCNRETTGIWMEFDTGVPVYPGALGYATPYAKTGTRIHILFDRVHNTAPPQLEGRLLGHVMAHELGHVLEGIDRHSAAGLMKAHWDAHDFGQMSFLPLAFSAFDVDLIQTGVARWAESSKPQRDSRGAARKNGPV